MKGYIDGIDWVEIEPMKYWSPTASMTTEARKELVQNAIFSSDYMGALKVDGYYERIVKDEDGNCFMIARSRNVHKEVVDKIEWLPQIKPWLDSLPNGTCVLCECYWPGNEGSKKITSVLGCLKDKAIARQKDAPLHLYVFDMMAFAGENRDKWPYERRAKAVREMSQFYPSPYVEYAEYYEGEELWEKLQSYLADGREGCVIMRKDAVVYQKRTPARVSIKVKKELKEDISVFVMGANPPAKTYTGKSPETWTYWLDTVTNEKIEGELYYEATKSTRYLPITKSYFKGFAGSLKIGMWIDGRPQEVGSLSGLTEEVLTNWKHYVGKVCDITGMMIEKETGAVRHPKFVTWREDLTPEDCERKS